MPPKLMTIRRKAVTVACCRHDSVLWRWQLLNCCTFTTTENTFSSVPSCAGTSGPLTEPQSAWNVRLDSGQAYWRSVPGRITVQKQVLKWVRECIKLHISRPKNEKSLGLSDPSWEGTHLPHTVHHPIYSQHLRRLHLWCSTWPPNSNPGSARLQTFDKLQTYK